MRYLSHSDCRMCESKSWLILAASFVDVVVVVRVVVVCVYCIRPFV